MTNPNNGLMPKLVGGVGKMSSNNGTQYYQQDRVYDADEIAMAHPSQLPGGSYYYMIKKNGLPIKEATKKGFKEAFEETS